MPRRQSQRAPPRCLLPEQRQRAQPAGSQARASPLPVLQQQVCTRNLGSLRFLAAGWLARFVVKPAGTPCIVFAQAPRRLLQPLAEGMM